MQVAAAWGQMVTGVTSWAHPLDEGMTARVQQAIVGRSLRLWVLPLLLMGLWVLLISLIG